MRIRTQCSACGLPYRTTIDPRTEHLSCPSCQSVVEVSSDGWTDEPPRRVDVCPVCGCRHLYRQRDFNRALGCILVALGAVLVPWTYGLSLVVLALADLGLYYWLSDAVVCYRCDTVFRDARPHDRQKDFELLKHDVLKYGKTWSELREAEAKPPLREEEP